MADASFCSHFYVICMTQCLVLFTFGCFLYATVSIISDDVHILIISVCYIVLFCSLLMSPVFQWRSHFMYTDCLAFSVCCSCCVVLGFVFFMLLVYCIVLVETHDTNFCILQRLLFNLLSVQQFPFLIIFDGFCMLQCLVLFSFGVF